MGPGGRLGRRTNVSELKISVYPASRSRPRSHVMTLQDCTPCIHANAIVPDNKGSTLSYIILRMPPWTYPRRSSRSRVHHRGAVGCWSSDQAGSVRPSLGIPLPALVRLCTRSLHRTKRPGRLQRGSKKPERHSSKLYLGRRSAVSCPPVCITLGPTGPSLHCKVS